MDQEISRRELLERVGAGAATLAAGPALLSLPGPVSAAEATGRRPNILVIMSDEHNADVMGCAGDVIIRTPNLDALAARGVLFEDCYCPCPICVPSRLALTAGQYPSHVHAWGNNSMLPLDIASLPRALNHAGYESFQAGKTHYDKTADYGFTRLTAPEGWNMDGKGDRRTPAELKPRRVTYPDWRAIDKPSEGEKTVHFGRVADTVDKSATVLRQGLRTTKATLEFLAGRQASDKPFFFMCGYEAPHYPLVVLEEDYQRYKDRVPMPGELPEGFVEKIPLNYRHLYMTTGGAHAPAEVKYARELYYALTDWTDREIGKVLDALARSPLADNTIVIYTSDHGENLGEHGLWWKGCAYETASRVPLIVSYPPRWTGGQRRAGACSLLDVVRTIVEIGGAEAPADWDGTSMTRWLDDPATKWKDQAVVEYYAQHVASGWVMIRAGDWKYVYHTAPANGRAERELYNLKDDPRELSNLAGDDRHAGRMAAMHAALVKELGEEPEVTERRAVAELRQGYGGRKPTTAASPAGGA